MPTVGWKLETAEERYWEHIPAPPPEPVFACPYCPVRFMDGAKYREHLGLAHPLELPAMIVGGGALLSESIIRRVIAARDIHIANATACHANRIGEHERTITAHDLAELLSSETCSRWEIRLINRRVVDQGEAERRYAVDFRIPTEKELNQVDKQFIRCLAVDKPRHEDLDRFFAGCPPSAVVQDYVGALGDYVLGIIVKEEGHALRAPLGFEEFRAKFESSREVLRHFDRPVARAVTACVDFNLNNFAGAHSLSHLYSIDAALAFFRAIVEARDLPPCPPGTEARFTAPICPLDEVSHKLVCVTERLARGGRMGLKHAEALEQLAGDRVISEYDSGKIHVLCAAIQLQNKQMERAESHLRALQFHFLFGRWALSKLQTET